jgi:hypothetical protein
MISVDYRIYGIWMKLEIDEIKLACVAMFFVDIWGYWSIFLNGSFGGWLACTIF